VRSRDMLRRLNRVAPAQSEEVSLPNLSVLTPWEYDRLIDLLRQVVETKRATSAELEEIDALWGKCPPRKGNERLAPVEISYSLERYWSYSGGASGWRPYSFRRLKMVERERFLELCNQYGWEDHRIVQLHQWDPDDAEEMRALLHLADVPPRSTALRTS
jgi:hypothetical protein